MSPAGDAPLRLLHVINAFWLGGAELSVTNLLLLLARRGHTCHVLAVQEADTPNPVGDELRRRLARGGVYSRVIGGRRPRRSCLYSPLLLLDHIRRFRPHLVHSHTDVPDFVVSLALRLRRFPVARTIRNTSLWETHPRAGRFCEAAYHDELVAANSAGSLDAYRNLRSRCALPESAHQRVIYTSFAEEPPDERLERRDLAARFGADTSKTLLCFAGRLTDQKGLDVALRALARLDRRTLDRLELHAFGDGPQRGALQRQIDAARLPVTLHAPVAKIAHAFSAFDAVIMPSRFEGLGRVAVESILAGTPVVASRVAGMDEALPPDWPLFASNGDATALQRALERYLRAPELGDAAVAAAARWARRRFSPEHEAQEYEEAYLRYLGAAAAHGERQ